MATDPLHWGAGDGIPPSTPRESPAGTRRRRLSATRVAETVNAENLGLLSLALGLAALLAPRAIGRMTGLGERDALLRFIGARELTSGFGLLTGKRKTAWLWSRVAGDAIDLAVIATALRSDNPARNRALTTAAVVAAIAAADVAASLRGQRSSDSAVNRADAYLEAAVITQKTPEECYAFWRDLSNLPKFMRSVESVTPADGLRLHWRLRGPLRSSWEWDAQITTDRPGECIAWKSVEGAEIQQAGMVSFGPATGQRGTFVRLSQHYRPSAGSIGVKLAKLFASDPRSEAREDLRRFRQLIETGEIPSTRGQPSGRRSLLGRATSEGRRSREGNPT